MNHDAKLGIGDASGMFFHAAAGTALPAYPSATLSSAWKEVGDVSDAGLSLAFTKSTTNLRNWANQVKRTVMTEHAEAITAPIMDTTEETFKTVLGSAAVTTTPAGGSHGKLVKASLSQSTLPPEEAYLFLMKDEDDLIMLGCKKGQITAMDTVTFAPGSTINWSPTITALDDGWEIITEDGPTGATGAT